MKSYISKTLTIFLIIFIVFSLFSNVFASDLKTSLDVIQKESETKYFENDQGYISKTVVDSNANTGEVTIELKLSNTKKETVTNETTEVFFVIDNSPSMEYVTENGDVRKTLIINSAKSLATSIFSQSNSVKIGIVKFSGAGFLTPAGISNATLEQALSNDKDTVLAGIQKIADSATSSGTNIDAGLKRANSKFSEDCKNKIIVLFTDGVPTCDASGTSSSNATTTNEKKLVQTNTKSTIQNISNEGVYIISMMTGLDPASDNYESDLEGITNIFGTTENPTAGKFYNIADTNITNIVNNNILADVIERVQNPINTVKVTDYFPEDITDNFEFSYVGNPSIGTVSDSIDAESNTIKWEIGTLKGDEVATLRYKLKIKDMKNENLLNKTIATNEKVVLTYTDTESKNYTVTLLSSPKIQLSEIKEELTADNIKGKDDTTTATGKLPETGESITIIFIVLLILVFSIITYKKYNSYKDVK